MKKMLLLATVLFAFSAMSAVADDTTYIYGAGGAWWDDGNWVYCPMPADDTCAIVITDDWGNTTSVIFGWPGGTRVGRRFTYCPNPGPDVCAIVLEGPNPGDPSTHAFFGKGGARRYNNGTWVYCPIPADVICAIVKVGPPGTPTTTTVYGAGGIYIYPDYVDYCPLDGEEVCATITEQYLPPPPHDTNRDAGQQLLLDRTHMNTMTTPAVKPGEVNELRQVAREAVKATETTKDLD